MYRKLLPLLLLVLAFPASADAAKFTLKPANPGLAAKASALGADGLVTASVAGVLNDANRDATYGASCSTSAFGSIAAAADRWCFQSDDTTTTQWIPQGVTTNADSGAGPGALAVSWYDDKDAPEKGIRLTILNPATGKYRLVLLVVPWTNTKNHASYKAIDIHAGGIAWRGNYLYVADTTYGLRVFDTSKIYDLAASPAGNTGDESQIGRHNNKYYAFGYRYILPQVGSYDVTGARNDGNFNCKAGQNIKFSAVAIDHSGATPYLEASEYCSSGARGRVAKWVMNPDGSLKLGGKGRARSVASYTLPVQRIQGAVSRGNIWYLSQSNGGSSNGRLIKATVSPGALRAAGPGKRVGIGPEDLSYDVAAHKVWTVTEHAGKRVLYATHVK